MSTVFLFSFIVKYMLLLSLRAREAVRVRMYVREQKLCQVLSRQSCQRAFYIQKMAIENYWWSNPNVKHMYMQA